MGIASRRQYKYLTKEGEGAQTFPSSVPCYLPSKANACYEAANGSLMFCGTCYQDGTPSPSAPVTVQYVDGDGRVADATQTGGQTLTIPDLYGIGDVRDTYEPCVMVDGVLRSRLIRRIGVVEDLSDETWIKGSVFYCYVSGKKSGYNTTLCSAYPTYGGWIGSMPDESITSHPTDAEVVYLKNTAISTVEDLTASLEGVPLYYVRTTPVSTLGDPQPVQSYSGTTNIFHTSTVQPKIGATVVTHS